jgi:tetratricopeptide (TPR) repeat protein
MFDDEEEVGFVICASCGTRIKANRERCLRCEAPLVAWQKPELLPPWLQRIGGGTLIFGIVAVMILLFGAAMFVESRSTDDAARPLSSAGVPRAVQSLTPSGTPAASAPLSAVEPVASLDTPRRGGVDLLRGDFSGLRARYEEQLEKKPADPELLNNLGLILERLGRIDEAIARFESALQADPQNFSYHFNIAHATSQRREWDRSISEYRLAAALLPTDYATRYNLGMALHLKGDEVGAVPELQKGIEMAPSVGPFHLLLGVVFEKLGRTSEAAQEYETYLAMAPSAPDAGRVRSHRQLLPASPRS